MPLVPAVPEYSDLHLTRERFERGDVPVGDAPAAPGIVIPFGRNVRDRSYFEATIAGEWRKSVAAIVRIGQLLNQAHEELSQAEFNALRLPFLKRAVFAFRRIGKHPVISDPVHHGALPGCWRTLDELITVASDSLLKAAIADGRIHPDLQRKDVRQALGLPPKPTGSKRKTDSQEEEAPLDAAAVWAGFSTEDKRTILKREGRVGLAQLMSPEQLTDLVDHAIRQEMVGASARPKPAVTLTAIMRVALDPATAGADAVIERFKVKLKSLGLDLHDVSIAVRGKSKKGMR
jgi:hypothetical protein